MERSRVKISFWNVLIHPAVGYGYRLWVFPARPMGRSHLYALSLSFSYIPFGNTHFWTKKKNFCSIFDECFNCMKVGVSIASDAVKLLRDYNVNVTPLDDLSDFANLKLGGSGKQWGLSSLTETLVCKQVTFCLFPFPDSVHPNIVGIGVEILVLELSIVCA